MKLVDRIKKRYAHFCRTLRDTCYTEGKRHYYVGDVAPDSLLNRKPNAGPIGAMISVDPETKIIKAIFIP